VSLFLRQVPEDERNPNQQWLGFFDSLDSVKNSLKTKTPLFYAILMLPGMGSIFHSRAVV
jgi:hypothetical protein